MNALGFLVPLAVALGGVFAAMFVASVKSGQWEDLDGAARRPIEDDDVVPPR
jgi:cbb3-type cytochrome oxidase maturation protein